MLKKPWKQKLRSKIFQRNCGRCFGLWRWGLYSKRLEKSVPSKITLRQRTKAQKWTGNSTWSIMANWILSSNTGERQLFSLSIQPENVWQWAEKCCGLFRWCPTLTDPKAITCFIKAHNISHPLPSRYANRSRSAFFISVYSQGLSRAEVAWANRKDHSHRVLPPSMVLAVRQSFETAHRQLTVSVTGWYYLHHSLV